MKVWRPQTAYALKQGPAWASMLGEIADCGTVEAVWAWWANFVLTRHRDYPEVWCLSLRDACEAREDELLAGLHHAELDAAFAATMQA
jgi:hypothetical protein